MTSAAKKSCTTVCALNFGIWFQSFLFGKVVLSAKTMLNCAVSHVAALNLYLNFCNHECCLANLYYFFSYECKIYDGNMIWKDTKSL